MFKVTGLSLANWKNFRRVELPIRARTFLFGANATGKSNLLDALRFLRDVTHDGLQKAVLARGGYAKMRHFAAAEGEDIRIHAALSDEASGTRWAYLLRFRAAADAPEAVEVVDETVWRDDAVLWRRNPRAGCDAGERATDGGAEDEWTRRFTHLEQPNMSAAFRPVFVFFRRIVYVNVIPQVVRESHAFRSAIQRDDFYGMNLLEEIAHTAPEVRDRRIDAIARVLRIVLPNFVRLAYANDAGQPHLSIEQGADPARRATLHEDQFSDGTLRLIGILWFMLDGSGLLLLEEPELYLHSEIVRQLPLLIASAQANRAGDARQVMISSHSYDLINSETIDPNEILMLLTVGDEARAIVAGSDEAVIAKIRAGYTPADAVIPRITPRAISEGQLSAIDML